MHTEERGAPKLMLHEDEGKVSFGVETAHLTEQQFLFFKYLYDKRGTIARHGDIYRHVFLRNSHWPVKKIVHVVACKVRKRLNNVLLSVRCTIVTHWGVGYSFEECLTDRLRTEAPDHDEDLDVYLTQMTTV